MEETAGRRTHRGDRVPDGDRIALVTMSLSIASRLPAAMWRLRKPFSRGCPRSRDEGRRVEPNPSGADVEASVAVCHQLTPALRNRRRDRKDFGRSRRLREVEVFERPLE